MFEQEGKNELRMRNECKYCDHSTAFNVNLVNDRVSEMPL